MTAHRTLARCAATALLTLISVAPALAQFGQDDMVVGISTSPDTFLVYDAGTTTWSNGPGWSTVFMQTVTFDNANGISHNASGNLLAANFGSSFTGFEIHNLATDGSANSESIWGIKTLTGGADTERGSGLSVNPSNNKIAWAAYDTGSIFVLDYNAGATPGSGSGASAGGTRKTAWGNGSGGNGVLPALLTAKTQGTTWLNDDVVLAFKGDGNLVKWDVSGVAAGTDSPWAPNDTASNWEIINTGISFDAAMTSILYNPAIDANHIYAAVTRAATPFLSTLYAFDYNSGTGAITLNTSLDLGNDPNNGKVLETREIAFDSQGNLYFSSFAGGSGNDNIVGVFENATNLANWGAGANIHAFFVDPTYVNYSGFDIGSGASAALHPGDANGDGLVNLSDLQILGDNWQSTTAAWAQADFTGDGVVNLADLQILGDNWGFGTGPDMSFDEALTQLPGAGVAIPEPAGIALLGCGLVAIGLRRRAA
ncbi:MAG: PEP-CTERM sorting domain-containing protein [Phycisphaeraceae bacterium]|nr:PEP-CTERM sorting domain-containing protein [Phycisphaeraceae bacterium]